MAHPTRWLPVLPLLLACGGGGGGGPTEPTPPPVLNTGAFEVTGSGQPVMASYDSGRNTVFCSRNAGWASLWIRLARDTTANGENGPHLDLDLCNHGGGGVFSSQDPRLASCGGAKTFDIFWHPGEGSTYANTGGGCTLEITSNGSRLRGTFACRGLVERDGRRTVDVANGSFECSES